MERRTTMPITLRRDPRTVVPDLIDWFEEPFIGLRPYLAQPIRIEDYIEDGYYVVHAEIAGVNPEKDLEVTVGPATCRSARSAAARSRGSTARSSGTARSAASSNSHRAPMPTR